MEYNLNQSKHHDELLQLLMECIKDTRGKVSVETLRAIVDETFDEAIDELMVLEG